MATAESKRNSTQQFDRESVLTLIVTALLLAVPAFAIGGQPTGVRAGTVFALLVLAATAAFGRAAFRGTLPRPFNGSGVLLLMSAFALLAAMSVGWSLLPNDSYFDAIRLIAYTAVLATAALAAQLLPNRTREIIAGVVVAAALISGYALLSRIFPGWFPESDAFARLRMPFEYWNAVGSVAAFGLLGALWLGTQRSAATWQQVISYPLGGIFFVTLMLSQSRGALLAAIVGVAIWLLLVDRRLRSTAWLATVVAVGSIVIAWAFGQPSLSLDAVALSDRESTGRVLAVALVLMSAALAAIGYAVERRRTTVAIPPARRYAAGKALLIALAIAPFVLIAGVAVTADNGISAIPDRASALFEGTATAPTNSPDRLTQTTSLRARYWNDAFKVYDEHAWKGTGADTYSVARLPFRTDIIDVLHAHGFIPQVLSDLGIFGLVLALALALAWLVSAFRVAGARRASPTKWLEHADDRKLAEIAILLVAVAFGVQSAIDWTWFIPGVAFFGLITAGWVAGSRSAHPNSEPSSIEEGERWRAARAVAVALVGVAVAFAVYQPVRAQKKVNAGFDVVTTNAASALELGRDARDLDPTSADAFFLISSAQNNLDQPKAADRTLMVVATEQPGNPETWLRLAEFRLYVTSDPGGAISALLPLLYQSPNNQRGIVLLNLAKAARVDELLTAEADRERRKLERELKKLQRELERQEVATPIAP